MDLEVGQESVQGDAGCGTKRQSQVPIAGRGDYGKTQVRRGRVHNSRTERKSNGPTSQQAGSLRVRREQKWMRYRPLGERVRPSSQEAMTRNRPRNIEVDQ